MVTLVESQNYKLISYFIFILTMNRFPFKRLPVIALLLFLALTVSHAQVSNDKPLNIILMIGDGMGVTQIYSGYTANHAQLNLFRCKIIGFSKTYSASDYITDSGAGGTAISTGHKTYNGAIAVDKDTVPVKTILEYAEEKGLSTGLVVTSAVTHATPAVFVAHQANRENYEGIAADFLKSSIDVFIGGGINHFAVRKDKRDLLKELRQKGFQVIFSIDSIKNVTHGKLAGLTAREQNPSIMEGRGDVLPGGTQTAINILSKNKKGFFLMVEGSQIDWGGHANNAEFVEKEVIDFDKAIGKALDFAKKDGHTLVIITADHETGGMSLVGGNYQKGTVDARFTTRDHTGVMVPVFAYGPGAQLFQGVQENTDLFFKMMSLYGIKPAVKK
jgi:alkaline phosphatase